MAVSGKFTSMAALLLMVAVLAGSANAVLGNPDLVVVTNNCNQTVVFSTVLGDETIAPNGGTAYVNLNAKIFRKTPVITITVGVQPPITVSLAGLLSPLSQISSITIECSDPNCVTLTVNGVTFLFFSFQRTTGQVCAGP